MDFSNIDYSLICRACKFRSSGGVCKMNYKSPDYNYNCPYNYIPTAMEYYIDKVKSALNAINEAQEDDDLTYIIDNLKD